MNAETSPSSSHTAQKEKFPVGMIILLVLMGIGVFTILLTLRNPAITIGSWLIKGWLAGLYIILEAIILGVIFIGILKRKKWARKLTIAWYIYHMVYVSINFFSFFISKQNIMQLYRMQDTQNPLFVNEKFITTFTIMTHIFSLIAMLVIIIYLYRKKEFFKR